MKGARIGGEPTAREDRGLRGRDDRQLRRGEEELIAMRVRFPVGAQIGLGSLLSAFATTRDGR